MADVRVWANCSASDVPLDTSGVDWIEFIEGSDKIIFTNGSDEVNDGDDIPSQSQLISAGIQLTDPATEIIVPLYLLQDTGSNLLRSIDLMGNTTGRYVMAGDFDAATASEPVFEFWDDDDLDSIDSTILGAGTPSSSFIRGITTTSGSPTSNWTGSRLAGSSSGHFLLLNDGTGPLTAADTLYWNMKVIVPASQSTGFSAQPVYVLKWLSN